MENKNLIVSDFIDQCFNRKSVLLDINYELETFQKLKEYRTIKKVKLVNFVDKYSRYIIPLKKKIECVYNIKNLKVLDLEKLNCPMSKKTLLYVFHTRKDVKLLLPKTSAIIKFIDINVISRYNLYLNGEVCRKSLNEYLLFLHIRLNKYFVSDISNIISKYVI